MSTQNNELLVLEGLNPVELFQNNGLEPLVTRIETECRAVLLDVSTPNGRKEIASLAAKIAKSKTALDKMGKDLGEEWREKINAVNAVRKKGWERLETLQHEIRKPLTDFENTEKARIEGHEKALKSIEDLINTSLSSSPESIQANIDQLKEIGSRDWQEFDIRARKLAQETLEELENRLVKCRIYVEQQAELERLQKAEQEKLQQERDARIAAEAAAKATAEAEEKHKQGLQRLIDEAEKATQAERDKKAAEAAEQARREADTVHRSKINNEALEAIASVILNSETSLINEIAKAVVVAIAKGQIPHVEIKY